jgi:hypothetical protein
MNYTFYHYTSGEAREIEADCDDQAWDALQDVEEIGLDELKELWYIGHNFDEDDTPPEYDHDDDEAGCC